MQIVICDDDQADRETIHLMIQQWSEKAYQSSNISIREFHSSEELLNSWKKGLTIDLLFLDIRIPGETNGIDIAREIHLSDEYVRIVFVTNYSEYVFDGYSVNALRYLQKPISQNDIAICMDIAWKQWVNSHDKFLTSSTGSQIVHVPVKAIIYIESIRHSLHIFTSDEISIYEIRGTMDQIQTQLPSDCFVRCHKSYIISLNHVRKYKSNRITLSSGAEIPVGRKYVHIFVSKFRMYYQGEA